MGLQLLLFDLLPKKLNYDDNLRDDFGSPNIPKTTHYCCIFFWKGETVYGYCLVTCIEVKTHSNIDLYFSLSHLYVRAVGVINEKKLSISKRFFKYLFCQ